MGSSNITRGFSASRISYSQLLHPLPADETTPARSTTQPGLPIAENKIRISALGGLPSDDHEVIQTDREEISKGPTNDNDSSIDWEDSVSESDVSGVDEKEPFPMTKLPPEKPSQPSLLTAMMCQSSSTTTQPAKAIGAGRITSSPAMHLLNPATNGPFLKISQDENDDESTLIMGEHPIYISNSGDTSAPSSPVVLSPTTIRENMLAHELDKSPIYHSNQEKKQRSTTVNSGFNRRLKAPNTANVEECSSWEYRTENQQTRQCSNSLSTQPICTEQSHENKPWNYYFDNGPWEYHSKGW
jgi:hypothetical protein